jgi:hypothetical protein
MRWKIHDKLGERTWMQNHVYNMIPVSQKEKEMEERKEGRKEKKGHLKEVY